MRFSRRSALTLALSVIVCAVPAASVDRLGPQERNVGLQTPSEWSDVKSDPTVVDGNLETEALLAGFFTRVEEYQTTLRDLTAEETRVTETYKASGALDKRRRIVSDFLVYRPARAGAEAAAEYRDVRDVDGKPVRNRDQRALRLVTQAATSSSLTKELEAINRESERYEIGAVFRGFTMNQAASMPGKRNDFAIDAIRRDHLDGANIIVINYHRTGTSRSIPLPKEFGTAGTFLRGRLWLHATTLQLVKEVWEVVAPHPALSDPLVRLHVEKTYIQSPYGILVPDRLVFEDRGWFSHPRGGAPGFDVRTRQAATYASFKQFHVASSIDLP